MELLILNNRGISSSDAGGAEIFTHEVAKRCVENGHNVTVYCCGGLDVSEEQIIEGVRYINKGSKYTVYTHFYLDYLLGDLPSYELIVDEYTLLPFLTPLFINSPLLFLTHELAREKYHYELPFGVSHLFKKIIEPTVIRAYSDIPTVTVSESTKQDLEAEGLSCVKVVPQGLDVEPVNNATIDDTDSYQLLYISALKRVNLPSHAVQAFKYINQEIENVQLDVAGSGEQEEELLGMVSSEEKITMHGYVSEDKKISLMKSADLMLLPAVREGWGMVATEANACGTPVVGYDVPGLRDSIISGETGILVQPDPESMSSAAVELLRDTERRSELANTGLQRSKMLSWERTTNSILEFIHNIYELD